MEASHSVINYLSEEIRELIRLGPLHAMTWNAEDDPGRWLQLSVHGGEEQYLTVMCVLPPGVKKVDVDRLVGRVGRRQTQVNHGLCLVYYLGRCDSVSMLLAQATVMGEQCAALLSFLWKANAEEQIRRIGARGPRIPYRKEELAAITPADKNAVAKLIMPMSNKLETDILKDIY